MVDFKFQNNTTQYLNRQYIIDDRDFVKYAKNKNMCIFQESRECLQYADFSRIIVNIYMRIIYLKSYKYYLNNAYLTMLSSSLVLAPDWYQPRPYIPCSAIFLLPSPGPISLALPYSYFLALALYRLPCHIPRSYPWPYIPCLATLLLTF